MPNKYEADDYHDYIPVREHTNRRPSSPFHQSCVPKSAKSRLMGLNDLLVITPIRQPATVQSFYDEQFGLHCSSRWCNLKATYKPDKFFPYFTGDFFELPCEMDDRQLLNKMARDELEDKYLNLNEENVTLKKSLNDQCREIKKLQVQIQRLECGTKRRGSTSPTSEMKEERIRKLEEVKKLLEGKVNVLKLQLESHSKLHAQVHPPTGFVRKVCQSTTTGVSSNYLTNESYSRGYLNSTPDYNRRPPTSYSGMRGNVESPTRDVIPGCNSKFIDYGDENISQHLDDCDPLEECGQQDDCIGNMNRVAENIELIRLKRLLKRLEAQLATMTAHSEAAEREIAALKNECRSMASDNENMKKMLSNERQKVQNMLKEINSVSSLKQDIRMLEEQVRDLKQERYQLKDHNEKLLKLAANKSDGVNSVKTDYSGKNLNDSNIGDSSLDSSDIQKQVMLSSSGRAHETNVNHGKTQELAVSNNEENGSGQNLMRSCTCPPVHSECHSYGPALNEAIIKELLPECDLEHVVLVTEYVNSGHCSSCLPCSRSTCINQISRLNEPTGCLNSTNGGANLQLLNECQCNVSRSADLCLTCPNCHALPVKLPVQESEPVKVSDIQSNQIDPDKMLYKAYVMIDSSTSMSDDRLIPVIVYGRPENHIYQENAVQTATYFETCPSCAMKKDNVGCDSAVQTSGGEIAVCASHGSPEQDKLRIVQTAKGDICVCERIENHICQENAVQTSISSEPCPSCAMKKDNVWCDSAVQTSGGEIVICASHESPEQDKLRIVRTAKGDICVCERISAGATSPLGNTNAVSDITEEVVQVSQNQSSVSDVPVNSTASYVIEESKIMVSHEPPSNGRINLETIQQIYSLENNESLENKETSSPEKPLEGNDQRKLKEIEESNVVSTHEASEENNVMSTHEIPEKLVDSMEPEKSQIDTLPSSIESIPLPNKQSCSELIDEEVVEVILITENSTQLSDEQREGDSHSVKTEVVKKVTNTGIQNSEEPSENQVLSVKNKTDVDERNGVSECTEVIVKSLDIHRRSADSGRQEPNNKYYKRKSVTIVTEEENCHSVHPPVNTSTSINNEFVKQEAVDNTTSIGEDLNQKIDIATSTSNTDIVDGKEVEELKAGLSQTTEELQRVRELLSVQFKLNSCYREEMENLSERLKSKCDSIAKSQVSSLPPNQITANEIPCVTLQCNRIITDPDKPCVITLSIREGSKLPTTEETPQPKEAAIVEETPPQPKKTLLPVPLPRSSGRHKTDKISVDRNGQDSPQRRSSLPPKAP